MSNLGLARRRAARATGPELTAEYVTAVSVVLAQIQAISKYRSCAGHDRSVTTSVARSRRIVR